MYLRYTTVTKNGKSHTYWRLVRSIRTGNRVRQQTVAQLGELDAGGRVRARALAEAIVAWNGNRAFSRHPTPAQRSPSNCAASAWSAADALAMSGWACACGRRWA